MFSGKSKNYQNIFEAAKQLGTDEQSDESYFETMFRYIQRIAPEDRLIFRMKLTKLLLKFAHTEAYDDCD